MKGAVISMPRNRFNHDHLLSLCDEGDYGVMPPPLDPQVALNELARYFLGDNWYTANPVPTLQVNSEIVAAIQQNYKGAKIKKRGTNA